jgi:hypothetical protein
MPRLTLEQIIRETQCLVGTDEMNEVIEDIRKEFAAKKKAADKFEAQIPKRVEEFRDSGKKDIENFNKQFDIQPVLWVNIVLKF